jgi:amino acid transporter
LFPLEAPPQAESYTVTAGQETLRSRRVIAELISDLQDREESAVTPIPHEAATEFGDVARSDAQKAAASKLGTFTGVTGRVLLAIFGVILFLRLPFIVGQAGWKQAVLIMLCCVVVTVTTTLSMSAVSTNGRIGGGGAYYVLSRSLGPAWGGSIGLVFFAANAASVAMYFIGTAETFMGLVGHGFFASAISLNDIRLISFILVVASCLICLGGIGWIVKLQMGLLAVLMASLIDFFVGIFLPHASVLDFTGLSAATLVENAASAYSSGYSFWSALALTFPCATGIMAGLNISGDLKTPAISIPKGTMQAIGFSTVVYIVLILTLAGAFTRSALLTDPLEGRLLMSEVAVWPALVQAGVFAATISSGLAAFVGAPRVLQALCADNIIPAITWIGKGRGPTNEPIIAYFLTLSLALVCVAIGDLDVVSPLVTAFFLISYAMINLASFAAVDSRSPSFRPTFRYWNKYVGLLGLLLCACVMLLSNFISAILSAVVVFALFRYLDATAGCRIDFGGSIKASKTADVVETLVELNAVATAHAHAKLFRPHLLTLVSPQLGVDCPLDVGEPLVVFTEALCRKGAGVLTVATILPETIAPPSIGSEACDGTPMSPGDAPTSLAYGTIQRAARDAEISASRLLSERDLNAFPTILCAASLRQGTRALLAASGLHPLLRPNTLAINFPRDWYNGGPARKAAAQALVSVLRDAAVVDKGLIVARHLDSLSLLSGEPDLPTAAIKAGARIDVAWLTDDGGLTVLLPHMLRLHRRFRGIPLRVLALSDDDNATSAPDSPANSLRTLLHLFRIDAEVLCLPAAAIAGPSEALRAVAAQAGIPASAADCAADVSAESAFTVAPNRSPAAAPKLSAVDWAHPPVAPAALTVPSPSAPATPRSPTATTPSVAIAQTFDAHPVPEATSPDEVQVTFDVLESTAEIASPGTLANLLQKPCPTATDSADVRASFDSELAAAVAAVYGVSVPAQLKSRTALFARLSLLLREYVQQAPTPTVLFLSLPVPRAGVPSDVWLTWADMISFLHKVDGSPVPVALVRGAGVNVLTVDA